MEYRFEVFWFEVVELKSIRLTSTGVLLSSDPRRCRGACIDSLPVIRKK
jgi:hypothetical protein